MPPQVVGQGQWGPITWAPFTTCLWTRRDVEASGVAVIEETRGKLTVRVDSYEQVLRMKAAREADQTEKSGLWGC